MAGMIAKALRGAAEAGVPMALEQHRANLQAMRDKRLQQYDSGVRQDERSYRAEQAEMDRAHDLEKIDAAGKSKGATQADVQFMNHLVDSGVAADQEDAFAKLKELRMKNDPRERMMDLAQMLQENEPNPYKRKPVEEYFQQAQTLAKKFFGQESAGAGTPGGPGGANPGGGMIDGAMNPGGSGASSSSAGSAGGAGNPPMPGAQQAPDGNWYIEKNGQFFRIDPRS